MTTPLSPPPAVRLDNIRVGTATHPRLDIAQLVIHAGERVALIGPNGAGKTTLLRLIGGLQPASEGRVVVLGRSLFDPQHPLTRAQWRQWRAEVGQMMQGLHLVPRLSARDNVVLGALARPGALSLWRSWVRCYPAALVAEAQQALDALGISHRSHVRADRLSGGERQKTSLARLRLQRPRVVLADEPTSALDPAATVQACHALREVALQATLVTVVHDPALLPLLADRVIGLKHGRIVFDMATTELTPPLLDWLYQAENTPTACTTPHTATLTPQTT